MKKIDFSELYTLDYELTNLFAMRQFWKENTSFSMTVPRKTSALLYFCGCDGEYIVPTGENVQVPKGSVVYIPEGLMYVWRFFHCEEDVCATVLIEFALTAEGEHLSAGNQVLILRRDTDPVTEGLFEEAVNTYSAAVVSHSAMKAIVYRLLTDFNKQERHRNMKSKEFASIAKGIRYLETDSLQEKSMEEIAEMCHVSTGTFRRLFRKYSGMSPVEYRVKGRMEYAKRLLELQTMTVAEVARSAGFQDAAYFCRVFKKYCGMTPGEYSEKMVSFSGNEA